MASLLLNERPLVVLPGLAEALGSVDEAIILQQINYWLQKSTNVHDGHRWVYNTLDAWMSQFPWIKSKTTLKKHFNRLVKLGLVLKGNYNKAGFDRTAWYSIDHQQLEIFTAEFEAKKAGDAGSSMGQKMAHDESEIGSCKGQKLAHAKARNCPTNTIDYTETTPENTTDNNMSASKSDESIPFKEIIEYLNEKTDNSYKPSAEGHKKFIRARWHEGNSLDDFKIVIDYKANEWMGTKWEIYLRPKTLFATGNFDNYLAAAKKDLKQNGKENSLFANQWHPQNDDDLPF
ncbi:conserved phage C-terminal domain-containing protein [Lactobacillus delbrueckii]|uniref:conserved phage C-terminal domain-containing protein n=1 Tax=Lactobacillus delbrueckii TaxID=1584 RepID=UPI00178207D4|nr:conserved phage C-terminal domain-containing protein [Lactobacillus delbrueckii]MBD5834742.1 replication protein [Lactobacillus delbrueckii]